MQTKRSCGDTLGCTYPFYYFAQSCVYLKIWNRPVRDGTYIEPFPKHLLNLLPASLTRVTDLQISCDLELLHRSVVWKLSSGRHVVQEGGRNIMGWLVVGSATTALFVRFCFLIVHDSRGRPHRGRGRWWSGVPANLGFDSWPRRFLFCGSGMSQAAAMLIRST